MVNNSTKIPLMIMTLFATSQPNAVANNENMVRKDRKLVTENYISTNSSKIFKNRFSLSKIIENKKTLEGLRNLQNNWNTYGAVAFNDQLIDRIAEALGTLEYQPKIFPTGRNSIQLEYQNRNNDYLEFEIYDNNVIEYYSKKSENESEGETTLEEINTILENFYA